MSNALRDPRPAADEDFCAGGRIGQFELGYGSSFATVVDDLDDARTENDDGNGGK
jgi:hypothetical protein